MTEEMATVLVGSVGPALRESPDEFRRVIDVNLNGCFWMAQAFAPSEMTEQYSEGIPGPDGAGPDADGPAGGT